MIYTGHVLHENNFTSQVTMQGSLMRYYEYMHTPGIDLLTENERLLGPQAALFGRPPVGAEMASVGDVRVYGLAVRFREP